MLEPEQKASQGEFTSVVFSALKTEKAEVLSRWE